MNSVFSKTDGSPLDFQPFNRTRRGGRGGAGGCGKLVAGFCDVLCLGLGRFDSPIRFNSGSKARFSGSRTVIALPSVPLPFIKKLKDTAGAGCTVNDILFAVTGGVLRRHSELVGDSFLVRGGDCTGRWVNRALIPVAFPRSKDAFEDKTIAMRNNWAFVSAELPVSSGSLFSLLGRPFSLLSLFSRSLFPSLFSLSHALVSRNL